MDDNKTQIVIAAKDETAAGFASAAAGVTKLVGAYGTLANVVSGLTAASLVASVKSAIDAGDQLNKLSQRTGIAVESLSALSYASKLSDVPLESLATGIKKLSVGMNEAAVTANSKTAQAFKAIGVSVKDGTGALRSADDVLADIADRFAGMNDGAGKAALAVALFGKNGTEMIPLLNQGRRGLSEMTDEAKKLGLVMSTDFAKNSEQFNDNITRIVESSKALGKSLANDVLHPLNKILENFLAAKKAGFGTLQAATGIGVRGLNESIDDARANSGARINELIADRSRLEAGNFTLLEQGMTKGELDRKLASIARSLKYYRELQLSTVNQASYSNEGGANKKVDAPLFGGKDSADKEAAYLLGLRQQLTAASGDVSEYSKVLLTVSEGSGKDFSKTTKTSALELAREIDVLKANTLAHENRAKLMDKINKAGEAALKAGNDFREKQDQALGEIGSRTDALGKTPFEVKQAEALHRIDKEYADTVKKINESLAGIDADVGMDAEQWAKYDEAYGRIALAATERDRAKSATIAALEKEKTAQDALNASWEYGAKEGLRKYNEELKNVASTVESSVLRTFKGMEDALVSFVRTGKLDFKSLADSIISDLIRIEVQRSIMKPITAAVDGAGGLAGLLKGVFSGGSSAAQQEGGFDWRPSSDMKFATGGEFTVGGTGGTDSQRVSFMATPGEQVSVRTPSQQQGGGGAAPNVVFNLINQSGQPLKATAQGPARRDERGIVQDILLELLDTSPAVRAAVAGAH